MRKSQASEASNLNTPKIVAADIPLLTDRYPIQSLLNAFRIIASRRPDVRLVLAGKRHLNDAFSVWNFLDQHNLVDRVDFLPYYGRCDRFPITKTGCDVWINRNTAATTLTAGYLDKRLSGELPADTKYALFFTSFHPAKQEGNSRLMRIWLDHLRRAGYRIHLVYYMYDLDNVSREMRRDSQRQFDRYLEVKVSSYLTGRNRNGLNVHVDDWCGPEALEAVSRLATEHEYDVAIVNYPFMTAIFDVVAAYTTKILLTHDNFTDRNRRMLEQGYGESGWVSLDVRGERLACERSDVIVALQAAEAEHFRRLSDDSAKVRVISPLLASRDPPPRQQWDKLRIGYFGSSNWVNEHNIGEYMKLWLENPELVARSQLLIAGGVCDALHGFVSRSVLNKAAPTLVGRVEDVGDFFGKCDLIVNPERGGTGIKIKTLEAMAYGMPVLATSAGTVGLASNSRFHRAEDFSELVRLTAEIVADPALLDGLRQESVDAFEAYGREHSGHMEELLGPTDSEVGVPGFSPRRSPDDALALLFQPRVSVIIPFYKVEPFIEECLASVIVQDYRNLEILLVDDASPDDSRQVVERFAASDARIQLITHEKNLGLGPARNTGVEHSTGAYLLFLDSDDLFSSPTAVSTLVAAAESTGCRVVVGSCQRLLTDGELADYDREYDGRFGGKPGEIIDGELAYLGASFIPGGQYTPMRAWGTLIDRILYEASDLRFPAAEHEDLPHTPFLYYFARKVLYLPDIVVTYRQRAASISTSRWSAGLVRRYGAMWTQIKANINRFGVHRYAGDTAVKTAEHMLMKIEQNGLESDAESVAVEVLAAMLSEAKGKLIEPLFFLMMDRLRAALHLGVYNYAVYRELTGGIDPDSLLTYYRSRLDQGGPDP